MAVTKLTEARIRDLALGSGIHRDTEVKGLMVICHKTTKSYAVQGDVRRNGRHVRTVRVKIDRVDRIGLRDARNRARVLMSQIQSGVDPTDGPDETGITLSAALDAHLEEKQRRPRTEEGYRYHLDHYLKNWRNKAVADISRQMVRDMFADLKRRHGEPTAASVMRTLRAVINTAMRIDESLEANPVAALRVPTTRKRKVAALDLREWWGKVMELTPARRDLHVAMLLTGARRSSILNVRREDVDAERGVLTLTHMKTSDEPLSLPVGWRLSKVLQARMEADRIKSAEAHYRSPMQMLMRDTLGDERRSRIQSQIEQSGPVELASLAELAAATRDKVLAAALCGRVSGMKRDDRPFNAGELADVMFGEQHRELSQALVEAERRVLEALQADQEFETGKGSPHRSLQIAMLKKREAEIGAYGDPAPDDDDVEDDASAADATGEDRIVAGLKARRAPAPEPTE